MRPCSRQIPPLVEALHGDIREAGTLLFITTGGRCWSSIAGRSADGRAMEAPKPNQPYGSRCLAVSNMPFTGHRVMSPSQRHLVDLTNSPCRPTSTGATPAILNTRHVRAEILWADALKRTDRHGCIIIAPHRHLRSLTSLRCIGRKLSPSKPYRSPGEAIAACSLRGHCRSLRTTLRCPSASAST